MFLSSMHTEGNGSEFDATNESSHKTAEEVHACHWRQLSRHCPFPAVQVSTQADTVSHFAA